jgi:hypothetical protein
MSATTGPIPFAHLDITAADSLSPTQVRAIWHAVAEAHAGRFDALAVHAEFVTAGYTALEADTLVQEVIQRMIGGQNRDRGYGGGDFLMRDKLLLTIHELAQKDDDGCADRAECERRLGRDNATFVRLAEKLDRLSYLSRDAFVGTMKLSATGLRKAERLRRQH